MPQRTSSSTNAAIRTWVSFGAVKMAGNVRDGRVAARIRRPRAARGTRVAALLERRTLSAARARHPRPRRGRGGAAGQLRRLRRRHRGRRARALHALRLLAGRAPGAARGARAGTLARRAAGARVEQRRDRGRRASARRGARPTRVWRSCSSGTASGVRRALARAAAVRARSAVGARRGRGRAAARRPGAALRPRCAGSGRERWRRCGTGSPSWRCRSPCWPASATRATAGCCRGSARSAGGRAGRRAPAGAGGAAAVAQACFG